MGIAYSVDGEPVAKLPAAVGVYRFYGDGSVPLYIGKSVHIARRFSQHLREARSNERHRRLLQGIQRIDCTLTVGDVGAQLLENSEIKLHLPLFNRRQRRVQRPVTLCLTEGSEQFIQAQVTPVAEFIPLGLAHHYGLFRNAPRARDYLLTLARREQLCLRMLGLESGQGPCFARQLSRCLGACSGEESAARHNRRVLAALQQIQLAAWPWPHPILLREDNPDERTRSWHLVHHWQYRGSFATLRQLPRTANALSSQPQALDLDSYRILLRAFRQPAASLFAYYPRGQQRAEPLPRNNFAGSVDDPGLDLVQA